MLRLLREIELKLSGGSDVASVCRGVGISDATYYNWRKRFGGMGRSHLSEMKSLEKENARLKKNEPIGAPLVRASCQCAPPVRAPLATANAELELDKLILKESLNHLKPRA